MARKGDLLQSLRDFRLHISPRVLVPDKGHAKLQAQNVTLCKGSWGAESPSARRRLGRGLTVKAWSSPANLEVRREWGAH